MNQGARANLKIAAVIPARYGSTRLQGKPLINIHQKPLLQWVVEGVRRSQKINEVIVATDHSEIEKLCEKIGVRVIMTDASCPTGTDRIFQAIKNLDFNIVLNIQGDEPMIGADLVDALIEPFLRDPSIQMTTLAHGLSVKDLENQNIVKVITNSKGEAIYFSRFAIPYTREKPSGENLAALKHIGLYGYEINFLKAFCQQPPCLIEKMESLEQLRALYMGAKIKVVKTERETVGVDTPEDVERVGGYLK